MSEQPKRRGRPRQYAQVYGQGGAPKLTLRLSHDVKAEVMARGGARWVVALIEAALQNNCPAVLTD